MIKRYLGLLFVLLTVVLLSSCRNENDYKQVIPENASLVVSANLASIAEKGDLANSSLIGMIEQYASLMFSGNASKQVEQFLQSPADMGIDFREPVYLFKTPNQCFGITMKMLDKGDFEEFLKMLQKQNFVSKAKERDGIMMGTFIDEIQYGYDDNTILLLTSTEGGLNAAKQTLSQLFKLDIDDAFVSAEMFDNTFAQSDKDILLYSNIAALPTDLAKQVQTLLPSKVKPADVCLFSSVDFHEGKATLSADLIPRTDEATKLLKEVDKSLHTIQGLYAESVVTDDMLVWGNLGVNGKWLLDALKANQDVKQSLFLIERAIDIEAMIKDIDGDVAFCLPPSILKGGDDIPSFALKAQLKTASFLEDVDYWKESQKEYGIKMNKVSGNNYVLAFEGKTMQFGVGESPEKTLSLSTYSPLMASANETLYKEYAKQINANKIFVYIDLKAYGIDKKISVPKGLGFEDKLNNLKALVIKASSVHDWEIDIELTNKSDNFLKALLK